MPESPGDLTTVPKLPRLLWKPPSTPSADESVVLFEREDDTL